jgi:uncharacterized protein
MANRTYHIDKVMTIGVISDTHISGNKCELPEKLIKELKKCDLIIHAGDFVDACVLDFLCGISEVAAVCGNMDGEDIKSKLQAKEILEVGNKKICVMHGYGHPAKLIDIMKNEFAPEKSDIIIFGHSHAPVNEYIDGVLFFNPGSVTDTVYAPYRSYGIIKIDKDGVIKADIHKL